jgi:hypothetical protein
MTGAPAAQPGPLGWLRGAWAGDLPLAVSYWLVGVAGNMAWLALLVLLYLAGGPLAVLWLAYLASLAWFALVFAAVNRSARAYRGPPIWALLARAGVWVGVVRMWGEALVLFVLASGRG